MVNKANCLRVAKAFATKEAAYEHGIGYNQGPWRDRGVYPRREDGTSSVDDSGVEHYCGTVGCLAGWVVTILDGKQAYLNLPQGEIGPRAQELLGLDFNTRKNLFAGGGNPNRGNRALATCTAAAVLKNLAEDGVVDWDRAGREVKMEAEANGKS